MLSWWLRRTTVVLAASLVAASPQEQQTSSSSASAPSTTSTACNNSPSLCDKQYNAISHMGAHDSAFLRDASTGNSVAGNQFLNATVALDAGLRLLQAQVHKPNSTLQLCHTSCSILDAGPLDAWLTRINAWVVAHPNDVVTILLVNSDSAPMSDFASAFASSGLADLAYKPSSPELTTTWPTLRSMIGANARVVTFVTNADYAPASPYLLPEFDHVFETPFEVTDVAGFNCSVGRPARANPASTALASGYMSLVNHFKYSAVLVGLEIPDLSTIDTVNAAGTSTTGNLGKHLQECKAEWNKPPNFVLVDFWNRGDTVAAVDAMNGVTGASGRTITNGAQSRGSSSLAKHKVAHCGALVAFVSAVLLLA